jgi:RecA/RadA recombinase
MEREILPMIQEGMPLRIVAIDSLTGIAGTKSMSADRSVNDHLVGDHALTIQRGLQKLMPIVRNHKLNLFASAQIRSNVDADNPYAPKEKMAASWAVKHAFEYFISVRRANAAEDKKDIEGNKFENEAVKDLRGNKEITGHRIVVKMDQSSIGTAGRAGMITLDYKEGIINQHEEVFLLGYNTGVIKREGVSNYVFGDLKVNGKANFAKKIKEDQNLYKKILEEIKKLEA